jgi:hypothetical protein
LVPHSLGPCEAYPTQALFWQQPFGHEAPSQVQVPVVAEHSRPLPHAVHEAPLIPQLVAVGVWQMPFASQHPFGHDVALQAHFPCPLHVWPVGQTPHAAPPVPHAEGVSDV